MIPLIIPFIHEFNIAMLQKLGSTSTQFKEMSIRVEISFGKNILTSSSASWSTRTCTTSIEARTYYHKNWELKKLYFITLQYKQPDFIGYNQNTIRK